jgi:endoglucanase
MLMNRRDFGLGAITIAAGLLNKTGDAMSCRVEDMRVPFPGISLASAEFAEKKLPGVLGRDYGYPGRWEVEHFYRSGFNVFRVPFRWERLQNAKGRPFSRDDVGKLKDLYNAILKLEDAVILLDLHNYGYYYGEIIGENGSSMTGKDLGRFWVDLIGLLEARPAKVIIGLMNEPLHDSPYRWRDMAIAAIDEIRTSGWSGLILVSGTSYSGAWTWIRSGNAAAWAGAIDGQGNIQFEMHQYLTSSGAGDSDIAVAGSGASRLREASLWLREHGYRACLGEFGASNNPTYEKEVADLLTFISRNADVWSGWIYWAAGPMWNRKYRYSLEPSLHDGIAVDRPQMAYLKKFVVPRQPPSRRPEP